MLASISISHAFRYCFSFYHQYVEMETNQGLFPIFITGLTRTSKQHQSHNIVSTVKNKETKYKKISNINHFVLNKSKM